MPRQASPVSIAESFAARPSPALDRPAGETFSPISSGPVPADLLRSAPLERDANSAAARAAFGLSAGARAKHTPTRTTGLPRSPSVPIPSSIRDQVGAAIGADPTAIRLHSDPVSRRTAATLGAHAFAWGNGIWLGPRARADDAPLIAHEAAHLFQGARGPGGGPALQLLTPEEYANGYYDMGGLNLQEEELGWSLAVKVRDGDTEFAREVFMEIGSGNRDEVAEALVDSLTDEELQNAMPNARRLFDFLYINLVTGSVYAGERGAADRLYTVNPQLRNVRLVPFENTTHYMQGMRRSFVVRSSDQPRTDDEIRTGDKTISSHTQGVRLANLDYVDPRSMHHYASPGPNHGGFIVHLMFEGEYRLTGNVTIPGRAPSKLERKLDVRTFTSVSDASVARNLVHRATMPPGETGPQLPEVYAEREREFGNFRSLHDKVVLQRSRSLREAFDQGLISSDIFNPASELISGMTAKAPSIADGTLKDADAIELGRLAIRLQDALYEATPLKTYSARGATVETNSYTGHYRHSFLNDPYEGTGNHFATALMTGRFDGALVEYRKLHDGLDRWILNRLAADGREVSDEYRQLKGAMALDHAMRSIDAPPENITRLMAYYHPKEASLRAGDITEVPLMMVYWKKDGKWHLRDLTAPQKKFEYEHHASEGELLPPRALFKKLDYREHFPKGRVYYQLPGQDREVVVTHGDMELSDYLQLIALGLAVAGLIVLTAGAATPAAAAAGTAALATQTTASLVGTTLLVSSGLVGAAGAGVHMYERSQSGSLDSTTFALDALQIVAGFTSAGAIVAGKLAGTALNSARAGYTWQGAVGQTFSRAGMARFAGSAYVPLTATAAGADVMTLVIMTVETKKQFDAIDTGGGDQSSRSQAKLMLLSQLLVLGGLTFMSVRGDLPALRGGNPIELHNVDGILHARPAGYTDAGLRLNQTIPGSDVPTPLARGGEEHYDLSGMTRADYEAAGFSHVEAIRREVPGPEGESLAQVEGLAQQGDWRLEESRRLFDTTFNPRTVKEGVAALDGPTKLTYRDLSGELARTMADPSLSTTAMHRKLNRVVNRLAALKRAHATELADLDIAALRRQVNAFDPLPGTRLDVDGRITGPDGAALGSFSDMVAQVNSANASNLARGVDRQYVVVLIRTADGQPTFRIRSRPMPIQQAPRTVPSEPLTGVPDARGAFDVDVGAGGGGYQLDRTPPGERRLGVPVQTEYGDPFTFVPFTRRDMIIDANEIGPNLGPLARPEGGSVPIFGDALSNLELVFGSPAQGGGIRRMYLNNVSAHLDDAAYEHLAEQLSRTMGKGGRVELRWDVSAEDLAGNVRGHIDGDRLAEAIRTHTARDIDTTQPLQETAYPFTINVAARRGVEQDALERFDAPTGDSEEISRRLAIIFE